MGWATQYITRLGAGETVSFRPRGHSMTPKIESGQLCTVEPVDPTTLQVGDIVLCKVRGAEYLHLVRAIQDSRPRCSDSVFTGLFGGLLILAHHDTESIVVYQAYRPAIARHALAHGAFGGAEFSFARMSWIKPNFLWMMYRCGWATKEGQEVVLGLRIRRAFFDRILNLAVPMSACSGIRTTGRRDSRARGVPSSSACAASCCARSRRARSSS